MLVTASFYEPGYWRGELYRISLGYPRGQKKVWRDLPFLAPSRDIVQAYKSHQIDAQEYAQRYRALLKERWGEVQGWLDSLSPERDITLLCYERAGEFCHRQVVVELVKEKRLDIPIDMK